MFAPSLIIVFALLMPQQALAEWSFKKIGPLGKGNTVERSNRVAPRRSDDWIVFGPRPKYIGPEGFGYIPTLSDLLGE